MTRFADLLVDVLASLILWLLTIAGTVLLIAAVFGASALVERLL